MNAPSPIGSPRWMFFKANTFPTNSVDEYSFDQCREVLRSLKEAECEDISLPFEAVSALVQPRLDGLSNGMGQLLASGVIVSSLLPMRILPAQVMILMGLGSSGFQASLTRIRSISECETERQAMSIRENGIGTSF